MVSCVADAVPNAKGTAGLATRLDEVHAGNRQLREIVCRTEAKLDKLLMLWLQGTHTLVCEGIGGQDARRSFSGRAFSKGTTSDVLCPTQGTTGEDFRNSSKDTVHTGHRLSTLMDGMVVELPEKVRHIDVADSVCRKMSFAGSVQSTCERLPTLSVRPGYSVHTVIETPKRRGMSSTYSGHASSQSGQQTLLQSMIKSNGWRAWDPDSRSRTTFNLIGMIMLFYDAFVVPCWLAWGMQDHLEFWIMGLWVTRIFWTGDLLFNFITGYRDAWDWRLEIRLPQCAIHYLQTWFWLDFISVLCDWGAGFNLEDAFGHRWRWIQLIRLVRVGRQGMRGWSIVQKVKLTHPTKEAHLALDISLLLLVILWANHIIACTWYHIGRSFSYADTGETWLSEDEYAQAGFSYQYSTALHWALSQMTPGSMEVIPASSMERFFTVSVLFFALLLGSSLVATLTSMMTQYRFQIEESSRKVMELQKFLGQQAIDSHLAMSIKLQAKLRLAEKKRLKQNDVSCLNTLSKSLQEMLWHACCMNQLSGHAFLNLLNEVDDNAMKAICRDGITLREFPMHDVVFEEGLPGDSMFFLQHGQLQYQPGEDAAETRESSKCSETCLILKPGEWCSESALWTVWTHLGTLQSVSTTEVLQLHAAGLQKALSRFPKIANIVADYCNVFHRHLNEQGLRSDLVTFIDSHELMSALGQETRMQLVQPIFDKLNSRIWVYGPTSAQLQVLEKEVASGKCHIGTIAGEAVRTVFVVALRVWRHDSEPRFLAKVGEIMQEEGCIHTHCATLPGMKRCGQSTPKSILDRLFNRDLADMKDVLSVADRVEQSIQVKDSTSCAIRTRYLRTTFEARQMTEVDLPTVLIKGTTPQPPRRSVWRGCCRRFHQDDRTELAKQQLACNALAAHPSAVVLRCDETGSRVDSKIYLWLTKEEFDALSTEAAMPIIKEYVASLQVDVSSRSTSRIRL